MPQDRNVTLSTIAKHTGVSVNTVSLALRNSPRISTHTREKIKKAAEEFGYQPNPMVRALMASLRNNRKTHGLTNLAYITDLNPDKGGRWTGDHTYLDSYRGICDRANQLGYSLNMISLTQAPFNNPSRLTQILLARGVRGIIIGPLSPKVSIALDWSQFASVTTNHALKSPAVSHVTLHALYGMRKIIEEANTRGYQKLGLVTTREQATNSNLALPGAFLAEQYHRGNTTPIPPLYLDTPDKKDPAFRKWLNQYKPDVLLGGTFLLQRQLKHLGLKAPKDIAVATIAHRPQWKQCSGIQYNHYAIGQKVVDQIVFSLERNELGVPAHHSEIMVAGEWYEGKTLPNKS